MRYPRRLTIIFCLLTACFTLFNSSTLAGETTKRVLILPLTIHSEKDLSFLNKGIMDMMASRISQSAIVIRKNATAPVKDPIQMGRDLGADYVVTGSLTIFGNSASTDAALTATESGNSAIQFNQFGQSSSDVLMHINQFATQVSRHIASISTAPPVVAPADAAPAVMIPQVAPPAKPAPVPVPLPTPQPVAVAPAPKAPASPAPAASPVMAPAAAAAVETAPLWTSNPYKGTISALAAGDVDGDGSPEIIFTHGNQIAVTQKEGERLGRIAAFDAGKRHKIIAVDAGDINGNGNAEIFVTRLNTHDQLDSMVLEWNGSALQPIATAQRWYFRVSSDPEKSLLLMGQRQGAPSTNDTGGLYEDGHFLPGVFEMTWTGKDYRADRRLPLPGEMTIYRFTRGDIFNDGKARAIAYSKSDKLRIYDAGGSPLWAGEETLGGNPLFLQTTSSTDTRTKDHSYLTQRFILADLDGDGTVEVATVHNRDAAKGFVERFRKYTRGRVIALRWNKVNMKQVWTGEEIGGYISDFSLADIDGDGQLEAVYAMVTSTGLTQSKSSNIVVEQIDNMSGM